MHAKFSNMMPNSGRMRSTYQGIHCLTFNTSDIKPRPTSCRSLGCWGKSFEASRRIAQLNNQKKKEKKLEHGAYFVTYLESPSSYTQLNPSTAYIEFSSFDASTFWHHKPRAPSAQLLKMKTKEVVIFCLRFILVSNTNRQVLSYQREKKIGPPKIIMIIMIILINVLDGANFELKNNWTDNRFVNYFPWNTIIRLSRCFYW